MPRGDGTGPNGLGPMTGRAAGLCAGHSVPGFMNSIVGRGFRGRGRGRGYRNRFYATGLPGRARAGSGFIAPVVTTVNAEQELAGLKQQAEYFQNALTEIQDHISDLEQESKK